MILALALSVGCGGGGNKSSKEDLFNPAEGVDPNVDLASQTENTFLSNQVAITVNPQYLELGPTNQGEPAIKNFILTNGTDQSVFFTLRILGNSGHFSLIESAGAYTAQKEIELAPNTSTQPLSVRYDASLMGVHTGYIEITATGINGRIRFPLKGRVRGPKAMKVLSSDYLCNTQAPQLEKIDFKRVVNGQKRTRSFKICNTGGEALQLNAVTLIGNESRQSSALNQNNFSGFNWGIDEEFNETYFRYLNIPVSTPFMEPVEEEFSGPLSDPASSFAVWAFSNGQRVPANNLTIPAGGFLRLEADFAPEAFAQAASGSIFEAVPFDADMELDTSLGIYPVALAGASGGNEPTLKVIPGISGNPPVECDQDDGIDFDSTNASIGFDTEALIFAGWIPENAQRITLRLCNSGSGSEPLKVWADPIHSGYFNLIPSAATPSFPIELAAGESTTVDLEYSPTPLNSTASTTWDLGQLVFRHNGGNGPVNPLVLTGQQKKSEVIQVTQGGSNIKKVSVTRLSNVSNGLSDPSRFNPTRPTLPVPAVVHEQKTFPYSESKPKRLQCVQTATGSQPQETAKEFKIQNLSRYNLTSSISLDTPQLSVKDADGNAITGTATASVDTTTLNVPGGESKTFNLNISLNRNVPAGSRIEGWLRIVNALNAPAAIVNGRVPPEYAVYFQVTASETGECTGSGTGAPPKDAAIVIIDRITMNLLGLDEPARNPPAFKFHLPIQLDLPNKRAKVYGLPYDPTRNANPVQQIRSFAHQISNINGCFPLPTNPYKLEFQDGSWDGPFKCSHQPVAQPWKVIGGASCIENNAAQEETDPVLGKVHVFYHEFVRFNNESCGTPAIEGKISTFFLKEGQTPAEVFQKMDQDFRGTGTESDYASVTRPYSFGSYMIFNEPYNKGGCNHPASTVPVTDPDELRRCWQAFAGDDTMRRNQGFVEECSYFQFEIAEGCVPGDADCPDASLDDPSTWTGYGEYEPDPEDDTKYHLTLRNVHIRAFTLVHSLNTFFDHPGKLLFSDLYVTLTTKAIGRAYTNNDNPYDNDWRSLLAENTKPDFPSQQDVLRPLNDTANKYWESDGLNGFFSVGGDDQVECDLSAGITEHCRGNFEYVNGSLAHAGEPIQLEFNNRMLLVGLGSFHGKGNLAPGFAREKSNGQGTPLYFTFQGCVQETTVDDQGKPVDVDEKAGCYDTKLDEARFLNEYQNHGILTAEDKDADNPDSKAQVNFKIYSDDRNRLTDYFNYPNHFKNDSRSRVTNKKCGYGN